MFRALGTSILLLVSLTAAASPSSRKFDAFNYPPEVAETPPENFFWQGKSGKWTVHWKPLWIGAVSDAGQRVVLHDALDWKDQRAPEPGCWQERHVRLLSVVGELVSYESRSIEGCGPKAEERRSWQTVNLSMPLIVQSIASLFPAKELHAALLSQPLIRDSLARSQPPAKTPRDLASLLKGLGRITLIYEAANTECYVSMERILASFALEDLEKGKTKVRLSIDPEGTPACREKPVELVLELRTPPALVATMKKAAEKKAGFLLKDVSSVAPTSDTVSRRETPAEESTTDNN